MRVFRLVFLVLVLTGCEKARPPLPPASPGKYEGGIVVLNEGLYQQNNASLCFYSLKDQKVYTQSFMTENGRGLGDTANDFEVYSLNGSDYMIVAVDVSSQVEILEANTLKSIAQIPLFNGTAAREPRRVKVNGTKAFVCNFDGTVSVIDLVHASVIATIEVGANPDGMAMVGDRLYVANSGGLNFPLYDSTVTVINMMTHAVEDQIGSRINCSAMVVDSQDEIYLLSSGNYSTEGPALLRINTADNEVVQIFDLPLRYMTKAGDWIYYYDEEQEGILRFNTLSEEAEGVVIIDCTAFGTFYGIQFDEKSGLLYCFDANGYVGSSIVHVYDFTGNEKFDFTAELNAKKIIYNE